MRKILLSLLAILLLCSCGDTKPPVEPVVAVLPTEMFEGETAQSEAPQDSESPETPAPPEPAVEIPTPESPVPRFDPQKLEAALADTEAFTREMERICADFHVVGMSVAVFANDAVIHTYNHGYADREAGVKAGDDTKYRSASVSKTATAICAMILAEIPQIGEISRLDLDAPISGIMNLDMDSYATDTPNTTRHLLTHSSSIVDTSAYTNAFSYTPPLSVERMLNIGIWSGDLPGTRYQYSNLGASLVSAVIESVTGERFYAFAQENLFDKLGLDAGYLRTLIADTENIANIYRGGALAHSVKTWGRTESLYNQIPLGQAYGVAECEMIISATDLAKLGIILAGDGTYGDVRILSPESVAEMNRPYIEIAENEYSAIGLRVKTDILEGRTISGHPGQALGMVGGLYFDISDGTGVAILTNGCLVTYNSNNMYGINQAVIEAVYGHFFG
ncbi:MAG: beta-lactamase family protein [Oscillospiraceae bacterium]|nr:beta-lactamase family protein [Oscillospiraceae bacterium]